MYRIEYKMLPNFVSLYCTDMYQGQNLGALPDILEVLQLLKPELSPSISAFVTKKHIHLLDHFHV